MIAAAADGRDEMKQIVIDTTSRRTFLPAAGHDFFLPFYDTMTKLMGADRVRAALVDQAELRAGQRVLDVGCRTGTLAIQLKRLHPGVEIIGLDPDPNALSRARQKAERSAVQLRFEEGFSDSLPYSDRSFDHVFSSFMFHHLDHEGIWFEYHIESLRRAKEQAEKPHP
jgi:2-polyprenyl-3-methyl-5-hydroxy-6-metoxy-1,4-benzoquinol methylase